MFRSKRYKDHLKSYPKTSSLEEAVSHLLSTESRVKFDETIDICVGLPLDSRKGDQVVKSFINYPNNFLKKKKILFFCNKDDFEKVKASGVDYCIDESGFDKVLSGEIKDFEVCACSPDYLPKLVKLARFLGPKGLMPNPKLGTVIEIDSLEESLKMSSRVSFRTSSDSTIKIPVGKMSLKKEQILQNVKEFLSVLKTLKPASVKNFNIKYCYLSPTMGGSIQITDVSNF